MTDVDTSGRIYDVKSTIVAAVTTYGSNLPAAEKAAAIAALSTPSPVDCLAQFSRAGYSALKKGITDAPTQAAMAQAVGQSSFMMFENGFSHLDPVTAQGMYSACRRWLGATTTHDPSTDPAIPAEFAASAT